MIWIIWFWVGRSEETSRSLDLVLLRLLSLKEAVVFFEEAGGTGVEGETGGFPTGPLEMRSHDFSSSNPEHYGTFSLRDSHKSLLETHQQQKFTIS